MGKKLVTKVFVSMMLVVCMVFSAFAIITSPVEAAGCSHNWKVKSYSPVVENGKYTRDVYHCTTYKCSKCGKTKQEAHKHSFVFNKYCAFNGTYHKKQNICKYCGYKKYVGSFEKHTWKKGKCTKCGRKK